MQRISYILLLVLGAVTISSGQSATPARISLKLNGLRQEKRVILRWMLNDASQWRYANEKGYVIERAEEGSALFVKLQEQPVKAVPRAALKAYDSASPVFMATAFVLNPPDSDSMRIKDEQLYSFYFLTASYETKAAVLSASGFIDENITAGKKYRYRITIADNKVKQDTGVWVASASAELLPAAPPLEAVFSNRKVSLHWNIKEVMEQYFSTVIEKSVNDSLHFATFSIPMVKIRTHEKPTNEDFEVNHSDYISNGIPVYYRIKGLNLFGITGAASNVVSGVAGPDLAVAPVIEKTEEMDNNRLMLHWTLPDSVKPAVARYEVWQSDIFDTGYRKVGEVHAGTPFKQQLAVKLLPVNYFVVKAIGTRTAQITASAPYLYQVNDSIPPVAPQALHGISDTNGVVILQWKPNTETDLMGYRLLKSTAAEKEFVVINATPVSGTIFHDTIPVKQLNAAVFYKIVAVDRRYNESALSAMAEVKRQDKIPPAPARLKAVSARGNRLYVSLVQSFSKDVVAYTIFRKASDDTARTWKVVASLDKTDTVYADKDVKEKVQYLYAVQAVDGANLVSPLSLEVSGSLPENKTLKKGVNNFNVYVARQYKYIELNWQNNDDATSEYRLYRATGTGKITLIAALPAASKKYVDENLKANTTYRYAIKVVYKDGKGSGMQQLEAAY